MPWIFLPLGLLALIALSNQRASTGAHWLRVLVPNGRISSNYGPRGDRQHHGIDIAAPEGSPIYAPAAGRVVDVSHDGERDNYGNLLIVQLDDGASIVLAHLAGVSVLVGDRVRRGDLLAWVGRTQSPLPPTQAAHVHVEVIPRLVLSGRRIVLNRDTPARVSPLDYATT